MHNALEPTQRDQTKIRNVSHIFLFKEWHWFVCFRHVVKNPWRPTSSPAKTSRRHYRCFLLTFSRRPDIKRFIFRIVTLQMQHRAFTSRTRLKLAILTRIAENVQPRSRCEISRAPNPECDIITLGTKWRMFFSLRHAQTDQRLSLSVKMPTSHTRLHPMRLADWTLLSLFDLS